MSCSGELAKLGYDVTIFEKKPMSGGLDTYGIVVFREPVEVSLSEVRMILSPDRSRFGGSCAVTHRSYQLLVMVGPASAS